MIDHNNLEEFDDALRYDIEDDSDSGVAFYTALAKETGGPVLEIACGTGRVGIPIARTGFRLTGVDIVPGMLAQARVKSGGLPVRWVEGDVRTFDLGERFRLVFITGNAFQAFLTFAEQQAVLARVQAHLHKDGLFAFEIRNPRWSGSTTASENYDGLFVNLETREEEKIWLTYRDASGREVCVSKHNVTTQSPRFCI